MSDLWTQVRENLSRMTTKHLHRMGREVRRELTSRHQAKEAWNKRVAGGFSAMANFMAGVTWALACRTALRESKGHTPVGGKRPQSGEMWLPRELLTAVRHQVKQRGWHPITSDYAATVLNELAAEDAHARQRRRAELNAFPGELYEPIQAQTFRIPFARQEVAVRLDDRFDVGGEA